MALTTIDSTGGSAARSVTAGLTKHGIDVRGKIIEGLLIASLATSLMILAVLIGDMVQRSWSVWTDRGHRLPLQRSEHHRCLDGRRVAGDQGDDRADVARRRPGLPARHRLRRVPRGVRRQLPIRPLDASQRAQPRRRAVGGLRPARSRASSSRSSTDSANPAPTCRTAASSSSAGSATSSTGCPATTAATSSPAGWCCPRWCCRS